MKLGYIVALLMIVLMVGCATKEAPPAEAPPAETPPAETPPAAPEAPAEEAPAEEVEEEAEPELTEAQLADIARLKTVCERGNAGLCAALKNRYGIDWPPAVVEEPAAEETTAEETVEVAGEEI